MNDEVLKDENSEEFGDFQEIKEEVKPNPAAKPVKKKGNKPWEKNLPEGPVRIRMPREGQVVGLVMQRLGGNRMEISCNDGKTRNCRVPGRYRRKFWLRPGDGVLIEVWPDDDSKGDVVFQYKKNLVNRLRKKGLLNGIKEGF